MTAGGRLGERLLAAGQVDQDKLEAALAIQQRTRRRLGEILVEHGYASADAVVAALAAQARTQALTSEDLARAPVAREVLETLGAAWCRQAAVLPLEGPDGLRFAVADPFAVSVVDRLRQRYPRATLVVGAAWAIQDALARGGESADRQVAAALGELEARGVDSGQLPVMLRALLDRALALRASDLHIEPLPDAVLVRCRVDGLLRPLRAIPLTLLPNVVNVLWDWAELPHGETQRLLDGSFTHRSPRGPVDVRLSAVPTETGPSIVLRLLDQRQSRVELGQLGYSPDRAARIAELLRAPYGLLLVTGPTGSGKTTTLYAIINRLAGPRVKVVTVEDPVEVRLAHVQQVSIREALGITFDAATRAFLRQDPDVIMIGEIRDPATAREAIRAALTGRRVLSTLHTSTAVGAIPRLLELGVEPGLLAETLVGVIGQRLLRERCRHCGGRAAEDGAGPCQGCGGSGEAGRTVASEVLAVTPRLRGLIERRATASQLAAAAAEEGYASMVEDARRLVRAGRVRLEEAERVLGPLAAEPAGVADLAP